MSKPAVVLLSGGLDSATTLAQAAAWSYDLYALTIAYGQRHRVELEAAGAVAAQLKAKEHLILEVDLGRIGGSSLTSRKPIPKRRRSEEIGQEIPSTYVPARNTIFLSLALGWAEVLGAEDIFFGANIIDYSGYPDCRPEYVSAFEKLANLATAAGVGGKAHYKIHAPLISLNKSQIIKLGMSLGVDYSLTHSCYDPWADGSPCGDCDACILRRKGFAEAGICDPKIS